MHVCQATRLSALLLCFVIELGACSWGVHQVQKAECSADQVRCGAVCLRPTERCSLGIQVTLSEVQGQGLARPVLLVRTVAVGSPAEVAGLRPGDAIIGIDDRPPTKHDLAEALAEARPEPLRVKFLRQGYALKTEVEINARKRSAAPKKTKKSE